jgi:hypothetical protein
VPEAGGADTPRGIAGGELPGVAMESQRFFLSTQGRASVAARRLRFSAAWTPKASW